jgi:hypothetical protein
LRAILLAVSSIILIYAITYEGPGALLRSVGYHCLPLPAILGHIYHPAINGIIHRDDPHRSEAGSMIFAYLSGDAAAALVEAGRRAASYSEQTAAMLKRLPH